MKDGAKRLQTRKIPIKLKVQIKGVDGARRSIQMIPASLSFSVMAPV